MSDAPNAAPPTPPQAPTERGTTAAAGFHDPSTSRMFPCGQCGADLRFDIGKQSLACEHCGHVQSLEVGAGDDVRENDFETALAAAKRNHGSAQLPEARELRCDACGANVILPGKETANTCAFCGAPVQDEKAKQIAPGRFQIDGALPFQVDRQRADANLKQWIASRWFLPKDFKARGIDGKFSGVYLPFWTFDSMTANRYSGERGEHYWVEVGDAKNRRRERRTRWYPAAGAFQRFFDDVLVCAAGALPESIMLKLEPWPLDKVLPFKPDFLAGFVAETYTLDIEPGFRKAAARIDQALRADVMRRIGGDTQRIHQIATRHNAIAFKHLLLPCWLLSYRYGETVYRLVVNAATGEVQGERPWSFARILLFVLMVVAIVAAVVGIIAVVSAP